MPINNLTSFYIPFQTGVTFSQNETLTTGMPDHQEIYVSSSTTDYLLDKWGYSSRPPSWQVFDDPLGDDVAGYIRKWWGKFGNKGTLCYFLPWHTIGSHISSGTMGYNGDYKKPTIGTRILQVFLVPWFPPGKETIHPLILVTGFGSDWKTTEDPTTNGENLFFPFSLGDGSWLMDDSGRIPNPMFLPACSMYAIENVIFFSFHNYGTQPLSPFFLFSKPAKTNQFEATVFDYFGNKEWPNKGGFPSLCDKSGGPVQKTDPTLLTPVMVSMSSKGKVASYVIFGPSEDGTFFGSEELTKEIIQNKSRISALMKEDHKAVMVCDDGSYPCSAVIQYGGSVWLFSRSSCVTLNQMYGEDGKTWEPRWTSAPFQGGAAGPGAVTTAWNGLYVVNRNGTIDVISRQPQGIDASRDSVLGTSGFDFFLKSYLKNTNPKYTRAQMEYDSTLNALCVVLSSYVSNIVKSIEIGVFGENRSQASRLVPMTITGDASSHLPILFSKEGQAAHAVGTRQYIMGPLEDEQKDFYPMYREITYQPKFLTTYFSIQGEARYQFVALIPRIERQFLEKGLQFRISYSTDEDSIRYVSDYDMRGKTLWGTARWNRSTWDGLGRQPASPPVKLGVFGRFLQVGIEAIGNLTPFFIKGISIYAAPAGGAVLDSPFEGRLHK